MSKSKTNKQSFIFTPTDWINDTRLRMCTPATRGLWIDILCLMAMSDCKGFLMIKSEILSETDLQKALNIDKNVFDFSFAELVRFEVIKKDEVGRYFCKRMVDSEALSVKRREAGSLGGNPKLKVLDNQMVNQKVKQNKIDPIYIYNNINNIDTITKLDTYTNQLSLSNQEVEVKKKERKYEKKEIILIHPIQIYVHQNLPNVARLKNQLTQEQCEKLLSDYAKEVIADVLMQMENFKQLNSKYASVYLTLNNWLKRRKNESTTPTNPNSRGANYENALRNF